MFKNCRSYLSHFPHNVLYGERKVTLSEVYFLTNRPSQWKGADMSGAPMAHIKGPLSLYIRDILAPSENEPANYINMDEYFWLRYLGGPLLIGGPSPSGMRLDSDEYHQHQELFTKILIGEVRMEGNRVENIDDYGQYLVENEPGHPVLGGLIAGLVASLIFSISQKSLFYTRPIEIFPFLGSTLRIPHALPFGVVGILVGLCYDKFIN